MRGHSASLIVLLIVIPTVLPGLSSQSWEDGPAPPGGDLPGLLLIEVCPGRPAEYVIIGNRGGDVDLNGTAVSDGEGSLTFGKAFALNSSGAVAIAADAATFSKVHPDIPVLEFASPDLRRSGRFALADAGDEVQLLNATGALLDLLAYGKSTYAGLGWKGAPVTRGGSADALVRGAGDANTSSDWSSAPPGRTTLLPQEFEAAVEPFTAPEDAAERLVRELRLASHWVKAAVYELSDPVVINAFLESAERGVNISILLEGQPVGGMSTGSRAAASALLDAGCDVRMLRSQDVYKRYDYLHSKYLVADGLRVVVMSENWGPGLGANRGWGVSAESIGLARYLEGLFDADINGPIDVSASFGPAAYDGRGAESTGLTTELLCWKARVSPVVSPDFSEEALRGLVAAARERVLVQQLYVQEDWVGSEGLLSDLFAAASRGVAVRVLLDGTFSGKANQAVAEAINAAAAGMGADMQAKVISPYHDLGIMHNKGMIVDDQVLVSSINWGDNALRENRELGLLISSPEAAGFFSRFFWQDWSDDPFPPTMALGQEHLLAYAGYPVLLDGSNITDRTGISLITWDLDGDGLPDGTGPRLVAVFEEGVHVVTVTAFDRSNNSAQGAITVTALPPPHRQDEGGEGPPLLALLLLAPVAVLIMWKRIKNRKGH